MINSDLAASLEQLEQAWDSITETPAQPQSTMDVIEYGLGSQQKAEVYVNRLLAYLLDPEKPHGMDADFLRTFLKALPEEAGFEEDTYDLSSVRVDDQVRIGTGDDWSLPDLVLEIPGEWFILVELKFSAAETGTEAYAQATQIRDEPIDDYQSGKYYIYIHQHDEPTASSDSFTNWTWRSFVEDVLDAVLTEYAPRYPQRTAAQLHGLRDDLRNITNMSDEQTADQEKLELYIDHADAIEDVRSAFDDQWETYSERWGSRLAERLDQNPDISVHSQFGNDYPEVTVTRAGAEDERWILRNTGGDWQHLHTIGWYKHANRLDNLTDRAEDSNDLRIGFYHRMEKHREAAVRDQNLHFKFRNMGSNPSGFKTIYSDRFDAEEERLRELLSDTKGTLTGNKLTKITATYDLPVESSDGFFEAYTMALEKAFVEFIVDNPELIDLLSETFDDAVEEFTA